MCTAIGNYLQAKDFYKQLNYNDFQVPKDTNPKPPDFVLPLPSLHFSTGKNKLTKTRNRATGHIKYFALILNYFVLKNSFCPEEETKWFPKLGIGNPN